MTCDSTTSCSQTTDLLVRSPRPPLHFYTCTLLPFYPSTFLALSTSWLPRHSTSHEASRRACQRLMGYMTCSGPVKLGNVGAPASDGGVADAKPRGMAKISINFQVALALNRLYYRSIPCFLLLSNIFRRAKTACIRARAFALSDTFLPYWPRRHDWLSVESANMVGFRMGSVLGVYECLVGSISLLESLLTFHNSGSQ